MYFFFFFNDTATTEIYTLSLHDALPIFGVSGQQHGLVTLDHRNQPVRAAKLWCDTSTAPEAEKLNRALGNVDELIRRTGDRKSTRLNSSHSQISYAVFCLKKKNTS